MQREDADSYIKAQNVSPCVHTSKRFRHAMHHAHGLEADESTATDTAYRLQVPVFKSVSGECEPTPRRRRERET